MMKEKHLFPFLGGCGGLGVAGGSEGGAPGWAEPGDADGSPSAQAPIRPPAPFPPTHPAPHPTPRTHPPALPTHPLLHTDCAYQGFASGDCDRDAAAIRLFVQDGHRLGLSQVCRAAVSAARALQAARLGQKCARALLRA